MRLLLDEHLDRRLKRFFSEEHEVVTVQEHGWGGKENGELIESAEGEFDALVTMDQGIPQQQNIAEADLVIVLLQARTNRLADLEPLVDGAEAALLRARPGEVIHIAAL